MVSDVDIANLALSHLGDDATVSELDPPEGSDQAEHCATFYPIARDELLERHNWKFCTRRIAGSPVDVPAGCGWAYAYAKPNDALQVIGVLPPNVSDDYNVSLGSLGYTAYDQIAAGSIYDELDIFNANVPQNFAIETDDNGNEIILCNQYQAYIRYTIRVTDPTKFSPLFVTALSRLLAAYLAGPVLKGEAGRAENKGQLAIYNAMFNMAQTSDVRQQQVRPQQSVPWLRNR